MIDMNIKDYVDPIELGLKMNTRVISGQVVQTVKSSRYNVVLLLMKHPYFSQLRFNTFDKTVYWNGKALDDNSLGRIATWMEAVYNITPSTQLVLESVGQVAEDKKYNPLKEYFEGKEWDGIKRLEFLLERYFGAEPSKLNRAYSQKYFVGTIKRAMFSTIDNPIKHEACLALFGRQGLGKSTAVETLAILPRWFGDTPLEMGSKDAVILIQGKLLYELKEMAKRAKDKKVEKAFIDEKVDSLRLPYGKLRIDLPRRCSFIATTNRLDILTDATGSRRWWPVMCGYDWDNGDMTPWPKGRMIDIKGLKRDREQLWLEALELAQDETFQWWLSDDEELLREGGREAFTANHPWTPTIQVLLLQLPQYFQVDDILSRMDIPVAQRDHKARIITESILMELGYTKARRYTENGRKWAWGRG